MMILKTTIPVAGNKKDQGVAMQGNLSRWRILTLMISQMKTIAGKRKNQAIEMKGN